MPTDATAIARLRGLLEVNRLVRDAADEPSLPEALAGVVADSLGFRTVVVNIHRPAHDDFVVTAVHGDGPARTALLGQVRPASVWEPLLQERFLRCGAYVIPHGSFDRREGGPIAYVPPAAPLAAPEAWQPEDALIVPMRHSDGTLLGLLSVDEPVSGLRSSDEELEVLAAVAAHVALALESARDQAGAERHRGALEELVAVSAHLASAECEAEVTRAVAASVGAALGFRTVTVEVVDDGTRDALALLLGEGHDVEGCVLLGPALSRGRAWTGHTLLAPIYDRAGALLGAIRADEPDDGLLPSRDLFHVLRAFANQAGAALQSVLDVGALRRAAETRRALIDASPLAIVDLDPEGRVRAWNPAAERIFGWREEEVLGRLMPHVQESGLEAALALLDRALTGESIPGVELTRLRADGSPIDISLSIAPLRDAGGEVTGAIGVLEDISSRKQSERAARATEARNRAILEGAPDCVVLVDPRGLILDFNAAAEETFGLVRTDALGRDLAELLDLPAPQGFAAYLAGEGAILIGNRHELTGRRADGRAFPLEFALTRVDGSGEAFYVAYARDVGKRRRADDRLREMEAKYRGLVEGLPLVTYVNELGPRLRTSYISPQVEQLLGYPADAWVEGGLFERALHPEDRERVLAEAARTRANGATFRSEYRLFAADGSIVHVLDETVTVCDEAGHPLFLQGYLLDLRERRAAEEALRQSEELYRLVVENALDSITLMSADGELRYVSPSNEAMLGYGVGELLAQDWAQIVHRDDLEQIQHQLEQAFRAGGAPVATGARIRHKDGSWVRLEGTASAVTIGGERLIVAVSRDVTERTRLEAQLVQAQKMEAVGRLAGGVAHDFNNLLTAIGGYADYVLRGLNVNDPLRQDALEIKHASDRAAELTQQLLAFSRQQVLQARILDVGQVVQGVDGLLRRLIGEDVELDVAVAPELAPVKADRGQLEQVIVNLALNARDAMPGGGRVTIACDEVKLARPLGSIAAGRYVALSVTDTGHGIDEETKAHLFEPFFTTKQAGKGTGLGLATVHGIVEQSGGSIDVWSEPGRGTRFTIYLPLADGGAPELLAAPAGGTSADRGNETLLLVEDEDAVRALARRILTAEGYTVLEARNGNEALELCELHAGTIHLVVTDVVMPGMSGRELVDHVLALRPGIASLFMSGYTDEAIVHHGVLDPDATFLAKPFTAAALATLVRETLDAHHATAVRVLVVEDEEPLRELIRTALTECGYEVLVARDPREALNLAERDGRPLDLLLTDIFMPRMNGRTLSHQLSALQPEMRLLYMSGKSEELLLDVGVVASGDRFLTKPFTVGELQARVRSVLTDRPRSAAA